MRLLATFAILIAALTASVRAETVQLFNGKDLSGWKMVGPGSFTVEDGNLKTVGGMGLLFYEREPFGDCRLRVVFKTASSRDNSGVFIRLPEKPRDPWYGVHNGYEVQIDAGGDEWHATGSLYSLAQTKPGHQKPAGEWNVMEIDIRGQTTTVYLNGAKVNEFHGDQAVPERKQWFEPVRGPRPDSGYIGLQNHDGRSTVFFKEIAIVR
ncbi:MAG: DUF1080 domain-containing protein [Bryobacteraceae bacterium]